ncbi:MAG: insulinase family protein [Clostridium sp.]|nr:insulinase family protein [Prevotella sp.]MCM1429000.1 insulinase family protein [Clostridium sp.]MCM1475470.1 insulinase family protein [Muribaculaceae bacterium]
MTPIYTIDSSSDELAPKVFSLDNGLRVVIRRQPGNVSYIGVAVGVGSRDESLDKFGLAHFVEHTIFKGTSHRRSWHISNRMESIGGELNAYTSKEETLIYTNAPAGYADRALELLSDIIACSVFPDSELRREREVVIEEIHSYLDSPSDAVYDDFEELIYSGSGLAHNILGSPRSVRSLSSADCREFLDVFYTPANMVVYISDPGSPDKLLSLARKYFGGFNHPAPVMSRPVPVVAPRFAEVRSRDSHQAHTIIGTRTFGRNDPRRFPLFLLNNYLGGPCMNSRLNQELRERRGLVYTVDSSVALLSNAGTIMIYFGCDPSAVKKCTRLIFEAVDALAQSSFSERAFSKIKEQYCGQLLVSTDNRESMAMSMGKSLLYYDAILNPALTAERVRAVTPEEFRAVAELLTPENLSSLTLQ